MLVTYVIPKTKIQLKTQAMRNCHQTEHNNPVISQNWILTITKMNNNNNTLYFITLKLKEPHTFGTVMMW